MTAVEIISLTLHPDPSHGDQPLVIEVRCTVRARIVFEVDLG